MQWIKHKKRERMAVAAKVIGAVRLGLVDIKVVIEELNTEEMQGRSEIHLLLHEALLYYCMPSKGSTLAEGKSKLRSAGTVRTNMRDSLGHKYKYFDFRRPTEAPFSKRNEKFRFVTRSLFQSFIGGHREHIVKACCCCCFDGGVSLFN